MAKAAKDGIKSGHDSGVNAGSLAGRKGRVVRFGEDAGAESGPAEARVLGDRARR